MTIDYSALLPLVPYITEQARNWVQEQQAEHRSLAAGLSKGAREAFAQFFPAEIVEVARFRVVPVINNPPFFGQLGFSLAIDFTRMEGVTFVDTVALSRTQMGGSVPRPALIFHELVHVVQYSILGLEKFMELYVRGCAENDFDYFRIPLERMAYALQARYEANASQPFSVIEEVQQQIAPVV